MPPRSSTMSGSSVVEDAMGSIVAFEGQADVISTQLRLLPTSPQILVLPTVQSYLPCDATAESGNLIAEFNPSTYIRQTHEAAQKRYESARQFLKGSTPTSKRLVFLNGGTPSAQALCLKAIMKHETMGNMAEAESIFNDLVRGGLEGMGEKVNECAVEDAVTTPRATTSSTYQSEEHDDPITRAMRAAEALDRSTASLQPSTDLDLTPMRSRPRSMSLPMYGYTENADETAPFYVFGAGNRRRANSDASVEEEQEDALIPPITPQFSITHYDEDFDQPALTGFTDPAPSPPMCTGEAYAPDLLHTPMPNGLLTAQSDMYLATPADVTFGEASLIDMRQGRHSLPRIKSVDRFYSESAKFRDICLPAEVESPIHLPARPHSCMVVRDGKDATSSRIDMIEGPRTIVVRPKQGVTIGSVPKDKKRKVSRSSYVDRGTDVGVFEEPLKVVVKEKAKAKPVVFVPVLPVLEDLVVYFKDDVPDTLIDKMVKGYKDGNYPLIVDSSDDSDGDTIRDQTPATPTNDTILEAEEQLEEQLEEPQEELTIISPSVDVDEYDPFAYVQQTWPKPKPIKQVKPVKKIETPPTPEQTPTPSVAEKDDKFHEFRVAEGQTAVAIQNSLRAVLNIYFPPEAQGYRQFSFSLLPELDGLWNPIFHDAEHGSPRSDRSKMDQILAIGSQRGVKKEYSSAINGLLEKLGVKSSGISRSGRLDFRYLLANAMQAYTTQPLALQTMDNPFQNTQLLATLIIPHLETYLALHSEVNYLILEYPPEHLPTVLALQKLVGVDLLKVAQIVDSKSAEKSPFTHIRGQSISSNGTDKTSSPRSKPVRPGSVDVGMSKANFILTSSASDTEIASFIATVRKLLMDSSSFYKPEEAPQKQSQPKEQYKQQYIPPPPPVPNKPQPPPKTAQSQPEPEPKQETKPTPTKTKHRPPPLTSSFSPFPKTNGPQSPASMHTIRPMASALSSPVASTRPASIAETIKTFKSAKSRVTRRSTKSRRRPPTADGVSIMTYDPAEDSDYDMEERRLMPIFIQKPKTLQKPNSRKALKFLGLA